MDYTTKDPRQAEAAIAFIDQLGEYTVLTIGQRMWRVSRHCIAMHGVKAAEIDSYGFEELSKH